MGKASPRRETQPRLEMHLVEGRESACHVSLNDISCFVFEQIRQQLNIHVTTITVQPTQLIDCPAKRKEIFIACLLSRGELLLKFVVRLLHNFKRNNDLQVFALNHSFLMMPKSTTVRLRCRHNRFAVPYPRENTPTLFCKKSRLIRGLGV